MKNSAIKLTFRCLTLIIVIFSYTYWGYSSPYSYNINPTPQSHYQYLSEGILSGHLYLSILPPANLLALDNPYDPYSNSEFRTSTIVLSNDRLYATYGFHDMSLYKNHFYLYFGPLPAVTFFIPFKYLMGFYPSESLGVLFFLSVAFIMQFLLFVKIKEDYFPNVSEYWIFFSGLVLGISNNTPFLLSRPLFYEVAIASAFCATCISLFFLYNYFKNNNRKLDLLLFSIFISLSIAGRPHFTFICLTLVSITLVYMLNYELKSKLKASLFFLLAPPTLVILNLGLYNYLRFDSFFEFGNAYQLSNNSYGNILPHWYEACQILTNIFYNVSYYLFQPYYLDYYYDQFRFINPPVNYLIDHIAGIFYTAPFIILALFMPKILKNNMNAVTGNVALKWHVSSLIACVLINFIFLIIVSGSTQRYITDFLPYLIFLFIVGMVSLNHFSSTIKLARVYNFIFFVTGIVSIYICYRHGLYQQFKPI